MNTPRGENGLVLEYLHLKCHEDSNSFSMVKMEQIEEEFVDEMRKRNEDHFLEHLLILLFLFELQLSGNHQYSDEN
jgi:hypothetical protein